MHAFFYFVTLFFFWQLKIYFKLYKSFECYLLKIITAIFFIKFKIIYGSAPMVETLPQRCLLYDKS
jgi:hypothetical protein